MNRVPDPLRTIRLALWAAVLVLLAILLRPYLEAWYIHMRAEPRTVTPRGDLAADEQATIAIFRQASPAVVYITTLKRVIDPWTRDVLRVPAGTGSGVVWDEAGHIVTNYHVVKNARGARVRLSDGRSYDAVLVGASPAHDLAVLRIAVAFAPPPPIPLGTSHDLQVGQKAFAIGNPFGLDHTLTTGVVSALNRAIPNEGGHLIHGLIQTDAAINPGNSGGPLLDSAGRLIGINTAIYSPSGAYAGIGFAIPVDTVNRVVPDLIAYGSLRQPGLGIYMDETLNRQILRQLHLEGVVVLGVRPGSPAEAAGLKGARLYSDGSVEVNDVILTVDGRKVRSVDELREALARHKIGDRVTLGVWRDGRVRAVTVTLVGEAE